MTNQNESEKFAQAAQEFVKLAIEELQDERGVHAETVIAGVARMAGTFLFRSFGFTVPNGQPGQAVLSEQANERGPRLIEITASSLADSGIGVDFESVTDEARRAHQALLGFLQTQRRLEPALNGIKEKYGLSLTQASDAAAIATALLISQTTQVLEPSVAFDLAVFGFIEGSKTIPDPPVLPE